MCVCVCSVCVCTYAHECTYIKVDIISTDDTESPPTEFQGYPITRRTRVTGARD